MSAPAVQLESSLVAEQFRDAGQQRESATLGMWGFLATEVLFFGALFVAYAVYRIRWPDAFREGSIELKWYLGAINTAVLLFSSFSMALAVRSAQLGENGKIVRYLLATMVLAVAFLGIKVTEYYLEFDDGLVPGARFRLEEPALSEKSALGRTLTKMEHWGASAAGNAPERHQRSEHEELFMLFYFIMTAIHATHMVVGIGLMIWLVMMARRRRFSAGWHNPVEVVGLYWHFVDTVWVFLFPILYLLRNP